jgi:hypothetical protein
MCDQVQIVALIRIPLSQGRNWFYSSALKPAYSCPEISKRSGAWVKYKVNKAQEL